MSGSPLPEARVSITLQSEGENRQPCPRTTSPSPGLADDL